MRRGCLKEGGDGNKTRVSENPRGRESGGGVFIVIITFCLIYSSDAAAPLRRVSHIRVAETPQRLADAT